MLLITSTLVLVAHMRMDLNGYFADLRNDSEYYLTSMMKLVLCHFLRTASVLVVNLRFTMAVKINDKQQALILIISTLR